MGKKLIITQTKSTIGKQPKQKATLRALGLRRISSKRIHNDSPVIRGMIDKVRHLVDVKEIQE